MEEIQSSIQKINQNSKTTAAITLITRAAMLQGFLQYGDYYRLKSQIKPKRAHYDIRVPSDEEMRQTISRLEEHHQIAFKMLLYSGIRVSELQYLFSNIDKLRVQKLDGFAKITLDWNRGSKSAFFVYLPLGLLSEINKAQNKLSGLQTRLKKLKLVPAKYARKYFAQKCLEAGIKSEVIDFYQGRSPRSILFRHYANLQVFADADYGKVSARIREVLG